MNAFFVVWKAGITVRMSLFPRIVSAQNAPKSRGLVLCGRAPVDIDARESFGSAFFRDLSQYEGGKTK